MSSTEPPAGSTPPPSSEPTPPPPPPPAPEGAVPPPPTSAGGYPPPPPPPAGAAAYGATPYPATPGAPMAPAGVPRPGELLDRFLARFIDGIIIGIVYAVISVILAVASNSFIITGVLTSILQAVLYLGYFAYFETTRGQTIGKQVMKLKVFGPDGSSLPTMEQSVRRNIWLAFGIAGVIPIIGGLIGGLAELAAVIVIAVGINSDTVRRQHWFDKFASGTQVVKIG